MSTILAIQIQCTLTSMFRLRVGLRRRRATWRGPLSLLILLELIYIKIIPRVSVHSHLHGQGEWIVGFDKPHAFQAVMRYHIWQCLHDECGIYFQIHMVQEFYTVSTSKKCFPLFVCGSWWRLLRKSMLGHPDGTVEVCVSLSFFIQFFIRYC